MREGLKNTLKTTCLLLLGFLLAMALSNRIVACSLQFQTGMPNEAPRGSTILLHQ